MDAMTVAIHIKDLVFQKAQYTSYCRLTDVDIVSKRWYIANHQTFSYGMDIIMVGRINH